MSGSEQQKNKEDVAAIMRAKQAAGTSTTHAVTGLLTVHLQLRPKSLAVVIRRSDANDTAKTSFQGRRQSSDSRCGVFEQGIK